MRTWTNIILCVLLSAAIWLIINLSHSYSDLVSIPVVAESNLDGRAARSSAEVMVTARVQGSGYKLSGLSRSARKTRVVSIAPQDFEHSEGDFYIISQNLLYKYASAIFGDGVKVESFVAQEVRFKFPPQTCKKVPVKALADLSFRPQYMALRKMTLQPDSVLVYAEPTRLESIDVILTRPVSLSDLKASVHGVVKIDAPAGTRLSEKEVAYSLEVTRYIEFKRTLPIKLRNAPRTAQFSVLPKEASIKFRCIFPLTFDPSEKVELYVDYDEFASSLDGSCVIKADGVPENVVINCELSPQVCVCVEVE